MAQCVILFRNTSNNRIGFVSDGEGEEIATFPDFDAALTATQNVPILRAYPWQIVELGVS